MKTSKDKWIDLREVQTIEKFEHDRLEFMLHCIEEGKIKLGGLKKLALSVIKIKLRKMKRYGSI